MDWILIAILAVLIIAHTWTVHKFMYPRKEDISPKEFPEDPCYRNGKHHNFEAIFEEVPRPGPTHLTECSVMYTDLRTLLFYKVYRGHICTWCGKVIKNE